MEETMTHAEINAAFSDKVRRGIFKPVARHLSDFAAAEDRLQAAICMTWEMFARYAAERNAVLSDGILVHSCRQRAVDLSRDFVPADGGWRNQDVLDPRAYRDGKVEVLRLDGPAPDGSREPDRVLEISYAEAMALRPERKMNSAIDLESWVKQQSSMDQLILEKRMEGYTLEQIAFDLDLTTSKVFERSKALGLELAGRAGVRIEMEKEKRGRRRAAGTRKAVAA
jgi:hypothetical protein